MANLDTATFLQLISDPRYTILLAVLSVWSLIWTGIALWRAAQNRHKKWFIFMLIVNTFGILEIIYVFYFSKPKKESGSAV